MLKDTGIARPVDDLGRFVIPKELRRSMHIKEGDCLQIFTNDGNLVLAPCRLQCVFCGNKDEANLKEKNGVQVCPSCIEEFANG